MRRLWIGFVLGSAALVALPVGASGTASASTQWELSIVSLNGRTRNITQTVAASEVAASWSPDGARIAYLRERDLTVVSAAGHGAHVVASGVEIEWADRPQSVDRSAVWAPDGERLAFTFHDHSGRAIATAPARGGEVTIVARGDYSQPAWSPDGSSVAFIDAEGKKPEAGILPGGNVHVADAAGGSERPLTSVPRAHHEHPQWAADARALTVTQWLWVPAPTGGLERLQLWVIALVLERGSERQIVSAPVDATLSPDRRAYAAVEARVLRVGASLPAPAVARPASAIIAPGWSPNGSWIAYGRPARSNSTELRIVHADGRGNHAIARINERSGELLWSPNAKRIAFIGAALHLINVRTGHTTTVRLPPGRRATSTNFTWSPTSDRLLYQVLRSA